jgi:hypothetical protein
MNEAPVEALFYPDGSWSCSNADDLLNNQISEPRRSLLIAARNRQMQRWHDRQVAHHQALSHAFMADYEQAVRGFINTMFSSDVPAIKSLVMNLQIRAGYDWLVARLVEHAFRAGVPPSKAIQALCEPNAAKGLSLVDYMEVFLVYGGDQQSFQRLLDAWMTPAADGPTTCWSTALDKASLDNLQLWTIRALAHRAAAIAPVNVPVDNTLPEKSNVKSTSGRAVGAAAALATAAAVAAQEDALNYEDRETIASLIHDAQKKEITTMPEKTPSKLMKIKAAAIEDGTDAAYRIAAMQITRAVKEPLVAALMRNAEGTTREKAKLRVQIGKMLDNMLGTAVLQLIMGSAIPAIPNVEDERLLLLAKELRVQGLTTGGDFLTELLLAPMRDQLSNVLKGLPEPKVRVAEDIPAEVTEGQAAIEETAAARTAAESARNRG